MPAPGKLHHRRHQALRPRGIVTRASVALALYAAAPLAAQRPWFRWGAQAIPAITTADIVPGDVRLTELRIVQPVAEHPCVQHPCERVGDGQLRELPLGALDVVIPNIIIPATTAKERWLTTEELTDATVPAWSSSPSIRGGP